MTSTTISNMAGEVLWGVEELRIERDALAGNVVRVLALALRFQGGEWGDAPGAGELPDTLHRRVGRHPDLGTGRRRAAAL